MPPLVATVLLLAAKHCHLQKQQLHLHQKNNATACGNSAAACKNTAAACSKALLPAEIMPPPVAKKIAGTYSTSTPSFRKECDCTGCHVVMSYMYCNVICIVISCVLQCCMYGIVFFCKCRIVCLVCSPQVQNCVLHVVSASRELCVLYCLHQHGILCFVLSPQAWNYNVIRMHGIVYFMWFPQVWNCVLCMVSTSVELCALYCLYKREVVALYCLQEHRTVM